MQSPQFTLAIVWRADPGLYRCGYGIPPARVEVRDVLLQQPASVPFGATEFD